MLDTEHLCPVGTLQLVELTETPEQSAGGIWLPENSVLRENYQEATVKRSGAGWRIPGEERYAVSWVEPGWTVVFDKHTYTPLYRGGRVGFVREEDLLGVTSGDDFSPLGQWVKIGVEEWLASSKGGILTPEEYQHRPRCGRVLDWGPGKLITKGDLIGYRFSCHRLLQMVLVELQNVLVWWDDNAEVVELGREGVEFLLVKAEDLMAIGEA